MINTITRDALRESIDGGRAIVVDALPAGPYARRHLPGAVNLVIDDVDAHASEVLPDRAATIVTYSTDAHCGRGEALAERLVRLGYRDVRVYRDGIEDWAGAGLPVEAA
jgi:rhodanese-related sulfurtransferase